MPFWAIDVFSSVSDSDSHKLAPSEDESSYSTRSNSTKRFSERAAEGAAPICQARTYNQTEVDIAEEDNSIRRRFRRPPICPTVTRWIGS